MKSGILLIDAHKLGHERLEMIYRFRAQLKVMFLHELAKK